MSKRRRLLDFISGNTDNAFVICWISFIMLKKIWNNLLESAVTFVWLVLTKIDKKSPMAEDSVETLSFFKPARSAGARRAPALRAGFWRFKKIPYQDQPIQLGPKKCTFWGNALYENVMNIHWKIHDIK